MGLAVLVLSWFDTFSQTGFSTALIRKPGDVRPYLDTFWTVQAIRGALLSAILFAAAPLVGLLFHSPEVVPIVRAVSIVAIMKGTANPAVIYLRRHLNMDREVLWRVGGNLTGLIVSVPFALHYRNAWALVAAALAANVAELILSYWIVAHRPRFELDWAKARELMRFGKWIFWSNMASYLSLWADGWVVGRFLGGVSLGYYQVAQQFGMTPLAGVGGHISAVALPAFSKLQNGPSLRSAYLRSVRFASTALLPLAALATVFADILVRLVLGKNWMPVVPLLRLLTWAGVLTALSGVSMAFLQAVNQPNQSARAAFLRFASFAVLFYPLMRSYGVTGVALAAVISSPVSLCYLYARAATVLGWDWDLLLVFRPALVACTPILATLVLAPFSPPVWISIPIAGLAGFSCIVLVVRQLWSLSQATS
jgi:PST family polysaccharide transporter/lipopolysaccharide exporter